MITQVLFDGDILVYRAGYSVESRFYTVSSDYTGAYDVPGEDWSLRFKSKKRAKQWAKDSGYKDYTIDLHTEAEPLEYAIANLERMIVHAMSACNATKKKIFITDTDITNNFRYPIAKTLPYKGQRKELSRPVHYDALREYLKKSHHAMEVIGMEADDMLGVCQHKTEEHNKNTKTIIASIDKDLLMIPGHHYNISTKEFITASDPGELTLYKNKAGDKRLKGYGFKWFCAQMLLGDAVDNISGINRVGPVKTYNILNHLDSIGLMWAAVWGQYIQADGNDERFRENAQLLWILRDADTNVFSAVEQLKDPDEFEEIRDGNDGTE